MAINGNHNSPEYKTKSGVVLKLRPLGAMLIGLWQEDYQIRNPEPLPPPVTLENGEMWRNPRDEWYLLQRAKWNQDYNMKTAEMLIAASVVTEPPKGWKPAIPIPNKSDKVLWVSEILDNVDEFIEAVTSLSAITVDGLEQAEKNLTPLTEAV